VFLRTFGRFPAGEGIGEIDADALGALFGERSVEILEKKANLEVRDDKGSGKQLEAEDAILGGFLEVGADESIVAALLERFMNFFEDFDEVGARAAARVEDVNVFVREAVGKIQFFAQDGVHASNHVLDDFGRGVPDAELLAEFGVEGLKEAFVEILNGMGFLKFREEGGTVDAVEDGSGPVEDFGEIKVFELAGIGDFVEELSEDGHAKVVGSETPVEERGLRANREIGVPRLFGPKNPGGEDAIKKSLDESGAKEMLAFFALESEAESFFQSFADASDRGKLLDSDPRQCIARVGGQERSEIFRGGERSGMEHYAPGVFVEGEFMNGCGFFRMHRGVPKFFFRCGEAVGFEFGGFAGKVLTDDHKVAVVGNEN